MDNNFAWLVLAFVMGGTLAGALASTSTSDLYAKQCQKQGSFMVGDRVYDCKLREVK